MRKLFEDVGFKGVDFSNTRHLSKSELLYEASCDHITLKTDFIGCTFEDCNLSLVKFDNSVLRDTEFKNCKLSGVQFSNCNPLMISFGFYDCIMSYASFYCLKIPKTKFVNCNLTDVDFVCTDLTSALFENCNMLGAMFDKTVLEKANLLTSYGFSIDPEINYLDAAKVSSANLRSLLHKYNLDIQD